MSHWLTRFDPDDGEPYGTVCHCAIGQNHTQAEFIDMVRGLADNPDDESDQEFLDRTRGLPDA